MDRDFKGVWIPKEIWLCKELSALDRVIYAEIDSLDNENHCMASNEYFAEFCGVSVPTVTRSIQTLIDMGYIEKVSFDGRHRILKVIKQTNQNDEAASSKCSTINITNNTNKKEKLNNKLFSTPEKPKKKNLYDKCNDYIIQYTNNVILQDALQKFLSLRLEIAKEEHKPFYYNMWPNIVNDLDTLASSTEESIKIVNESIEKGWKRFYPLKDYSKKSVKTNPSEKNVVSSKETEEDIKAREAFIEDCKAKGLQYEF